MKIDQDVMEVLAAAEVSPTGLVLVGQLDRKLYVKTNKVLEAVGLKWLTKQKKHVLPDCVAGVDEIVDQILLTGEYTDAKKEFDAFYTPNHVADRVVDAASISAGMLILEPSVGRGALMYAVTARDWIGDLPRFVTVEKNPEGVDHTMPTQCVIGDFLHCGGRDWPHINLVPNTPLLPRVDRVIMNPPFSKGQDAKHVLHALKFLKPGGRLVAIMSASVKFRKDGPYSTFALMQQAGPTATMVGSSNIGQAVPFRSITIEDLPEGSFKESGTLVNTVLVIIDV